MECGLNSSLPKTHFYPENKTENTLDDPLNDLNTFEEVMKDVEKIHKDVQKIRDIGKSNIQKIQKEMEEDVQKIHNTGASTILEKLENLSYVGSLLLSACTENVKWIESFYHEEFPKIFKNPSNLEALRSAYGEKIKWSTNCGIIGILVLYQNFINNFKSASSRPLFQPILEYGPNIAEKSGNETQEMFIKNCSYEVLPKIHSDLCKRIDESINEAKKIKTDEDEQKHNVIQALEKAKAILEDTLPFFQKMADYELKFKLKTIKKIHLLASEKINQVDQETRRIIKDTIELNEKNLKRINMFCTVGLVEEDFKIWF